MRVNATSGQGKKNELLLLLDYQDELSLQVSSKQEEEQKDKRMENMDTVGSLNTEAAKVHIDTLSPFIGFGGGIYQMTVVKRMTAKEDFLDMPLKERNCVVEPYENCRTRKLLEECKCVPAEILAYQVRAHLRYLKSKTSFNFMKQYIIVHVCWEVFLHNRFSLSPISSKLPFCRNWRNATLRAGTALMPTPPKLSTAM